VVYIHNGARLTFDHAVYTVVAMAFETSVSAVSGPLLTVRYVPVSDFILL